MKKTKSKIILVATIAAVTVLYACSKDFLNKAPLGSLDPNNLANSPGVKGLLIGAYSMLDGYGGAGQGWEAAGSNWVYGGVASDDAYKGSDGGDQPDIIPIETYSSNGADYYYNNKWRCVYDAVQRCNDVLRTMALATDMTDEEKLVTEAEARFLRAHYHFEAQKMWFKVPYVDETISYAAGNFNVPNTGPIWDKIEADLQFAKDNLPEVQTAVGRANKWLAQIYLAKAYMFQGKFADAKPLLEDAINNGVTASGKKYALVTFSDNFNAATKNSAECVFSIQQSVNDNAGGSNAGWGDVLNYPYNGGPGGCCGFYQPTQSLVNSYRVDANGLPFLDTWNDVNVKNDQNVNSPDAFTPETGMLDSRLDWTVGRRGIPYLDWGPHPGKDWIRDQSYSGPYAPKKNVYYKSQQGSLTDNSFWTSGVTANNYTFVRFADVLLWAAECEVEVGDLNVARGYVNQVRTRAADQANWVKAGTVACTCNTPLQNFGGYAANYKVGLYTTSWTDQALARKAVRYERKLELAMEGHRFFDLIRYGGGAADEALNTNYIQKEINRPAPNFRPPFFVGSKFTPNEDDYFPIPQAQIDLSNGTLTPR